RRRASGAVAPTTGVPGGVEQINLRTIALRDGEGAVHIFPNGAITALANLSKQFSYAIVDVKVGYAQNIDDVIGLVRHLGTSMESDPAWKPLLMGPLEIIGVEAI